MPAEVDGAWGHVDVHEVIHDSALDVVCHAIHHVALAHVHDLDVGQIPFQREGRELRERGQDPCWHIWSGPGTG